MSRIFNVRVLLGVVVVAGILAAALWPETTTVDVGTAVRGPLQVTLDEEGETRVRERFVVSAPVAGRLQRIELEPGDTVERGMVLASLMPAQPTLLDARSRAELEGAVEAAQATLGQARAERERAAAALDRAQTTARRQQELADAGVVSADSLDAATSAVAVAEEALRAADFSVTRAEYDLQIARTRLEQPDSGTERIEIRSPVDGTVLRRYRESESVVPVGEPLIEVGDPTDLEVVADYLSTDAVQIAPGVPVLIEQWGGGDTLMGRVRRVEPAGFMRVSALGVEEQRVNVIIDFDDVAAAARLLGDAYRVEVRAVVWDEPDVLTVPVGSLFRQGEDWAVFVVEGEAAVLRPVAIGQRNGQSAEVLDGLAAGDTVVLHPPDALVDGARVVLRES